MLLWSEKGRYIGSVGWGLRSKSPSSRKAGKQRQAACGVLAPRIVVRVFLVVRVVRGGGADITPPTDMPKMLDSLSRATLCYLRAARVGSGGEKNLSRVFTTDNDALVRRVDLMRRV